jgi:hypothetical protein
MNKNLNMTKKKHGFAEFETTDGIFLFVYLQELFFNSRNKEIV